MSATDLNNEIPFGAPAVLVTREPQNGLKLTLGAGIKPEYAKKVSLNAAEYDAVADSYAEITLQHAAAEQQRIEHAIALHAEGGARSNGTKIVADLGGAYGRDSEVWQAAGFKHVVLDVSLKLLKLGAQRNGGAVFMLGDMVTTPFRDKSIDIAWLSSTIQHIPTVELNGLFKKIACALKPDGIGFVNYRQWDDERAKSGFAKEGDMKSHEYRRAGTNDNTVTRFMAHYTAMELASELSKAGLTILATKSYPAGYPVRKLDRKPQTNFSAPYPPAKGMIFFKRQ